MRHAGAVIFLAALLLVVGGSACVGDDDDDECDTAACAPDDSTAGDGDAGDGDGDGDSEPGVGCPDLAGLDPVGGAAASELVATGFMFTEGPVWRPDTQRLLFTDIPANTIVELALPDETMTFRSPSDNANGLVEDIDGRLLAAEHGARRVSRTLESGEVVTIVDKYEGNAFNSPNDLAVRSDGTIYFTDPPFGLNGREPELDFNGVFRVTPFDSLFLAVSRPEPRRPNGIVLSPDETVLYLADSQTGDVAAFTVAPEGGLFSERTFATGVPTADGMTVDCAGNVYITNENGVTVVAPDGTVWGTFTIDERPSNVTFGGPALDTLFVTASTSLYRIPAAIPGLARD